MTISASPVSGATIDHGDSVSFTIDDTYTSVLIQAVTATSTEKVYDTTLLGGQAGYTVSVVDNGGGTHTFTFTRDAGWDTTPQVIHVTEDESGASTLTTLSYSLSGEVDFPQGTEPYNPTAVITPTSFLALSDTPGTYSGASLYKARVNAGETALEFVPDTGGGVTDHGALTGLNDDDHPQYVLKDGTREQDAAYFAERADHVNTFPAPGKAELWLRNDTRQVLMFTDDQATDYELVKSDNPGGNVNDALAIWQNAGGNYYLGDISALTYNGGTLKFDSANANIQLSERSTGPSPAAGDGALWVKNDAPNTLWFTDDIGTDQQLVTSAGITPQKSAFFTEQAAEPVTPTTGQGLLWMDDYVTLARLCWTDETGQKKFVPASQYVSNTGILVWSGVTGELMNTSIFTWSGNRLWLNAAGAGLRMQEGSSLTSGSTAGNGTFWVKNDAPNRPYFQDDTGVDLPLNQTVTFYHASRIAGTGTNTYIGASGAPWDYSGYSATRTGVQGSPAEPGNPAACFCCVPFDGVVTSVEGWVKEGNVAVTGDLELWKWTFVDDAPGSSATGAQLNGASPVHTVGSLSTSGDFGSISLSPGDAVSKGDLLEILYYNDGTSQSNTLHWGIQVTIERTA